jgi:hypothetical protein
MTKEHDWSIDPIARPSCWSFAMSFLGEPEDKIVAAYVEALEAEVKRLRDETEDAYMEMRECQDRFDD